MKADTEKVAINRQKDAQRKQRCENQTATIAETANHLVLVESEIDELTIVDLNKQLDFHREEEKKYVKEGGQLTEQVPLKTRIVMDTGMAPRDGSQVRGPAGRGRVRRFFPVTFPYPFVRVTGL